MITFLFPQIVHPLIDLFRINMVIKTSFCGSYCMLTTNLIYKYPREFGKSEPSEYDNSTVSPGVTGKIHFAAMIAG